jgi:50S ribosomal subunit-associated GTPase HflX
MFDPSQFVIFLAEQLKELSPSVIVVISLQVSFVTLKPTLRQNTVKARKQTPIFDTNLFIIVL